MFPASLQKSSSVKVDLVKQLVSYYPNDLAWATTSDQIDEAFASGDDDDAAVLMMMTRKVSTMVMTTRSNCKPCWSGVRACHWKQPCHP